MDVIAQHLMEQIATDELQRAAAIQRRWEAYHGVFRPRQLGAGVRPVSLDDRVVVNYARLVVDVGVSALMGRGVRWELSEAQQTDAERWLEAVWRANGRDILLHNLALSGAVAGHVFVKIVPPVAGWPWPRLVVLDPGTVSVLWSPDDHSDVRRYRVQYSMVEPQSGRVIVRRQDIERDERGWHIRNYQSGDRLSWTLVDEFPWPHLWPPVVDVQNLPLPHEFWGLSDLDDDVLSLNESINRVLTNVARILRFHAHPRVWARGVAASQLRADVDEVLVFPSPDAELHSLEMQSDLASSIAFYERLREALHEVTRIPEIATGKLDRAGALSGVALSILYRPLLEKVSTKRLLYGQLLVELNRRLLALGGFGDQLQVTLHWPELLPDEPLVARQAALLDQQLGVSVDTLLRRLGYDPDIETEKRAAEAERAAEQEARAYFRGAVGSIGGNGRTAQA